MADFTPPLSGGGGGDKLLSEAEKAKAKAQRVVAGTEAATADVAALRKRLTAAQRKLLDALAEGTPGKIKSSQIRKFRDLGLADILGDVGRQRIEVTDLGRQVADLGRQAERAAETTVRQVQEAVDRGAQRGARKAAARTPRAPKITPNTNPQMQRVMQEYLDAAGRGADAEARKLRDQLANAGVLPKQQAPSTPSSGMPQPVSRPGFGSVAHAREWEQAQRAPNFRFTPDPTALAREMAQLADPTYDPYRGQHLPSRKDARARALAEREQTQALLRPVAQERLSALSPQQREQFDQRLAELSRIESTSRAADTAQKRTEAERALPKTRASFTEFVRELTDVGRAAQQTTQATREQATASRDAQATEKAVTATQRATAVRQYDAPIGPQRQAAQQPRQPQLEREYTRVNGLMQQAQRRLGESFDKPSGVQRRIEATVERHRRDLERIESQAREAEATRASTQAKRAFVQTQQKMGEVTLPGAVHTLLTNTYATEAGSQPGAVEALRNAQIRKQGFGHSATIRASRADLADLADDNKARMDAYASMNNEERGTSGNAELRAMRAADKRFTAAIASLSDATVAAADTADQSAQGKRRFVQTESLYNRNAGSAGGGGRGIVQRLEADMARTEERAARRRAQRQARADRPDFTAPLGQSDEAQRLLRELESRRDEAQRALANAEARRAQERAGIAPGLDSPQFRAEVERERARATADAQYRPGTAVVPHPDPKVFGARTPGPIVPGGVQITTRQPVTDFAAEGPARSRPALTRLERAIVELSQAREAARDAHRAEQRIINRSASASEQDLLEAHNRTQAAKGVVAQRRDEVTKLQRAVDEQVRAKNAAIDADRQAARTAQRRTAVQQYDQPIGPQRPGTDIVPRTAANAGLTARAQLPGPAFGEYPFAPISPPQVPVNPESIGEKNLSRRANARDPRQRTPAASAKAAQRDDLIAQTRAAQAAERFARNQSIVDEATGSLTQRTAGLDRELQRQAALLGATSTAYQRHGALTTEFIDAARRGEASYREWGFQIGATAGKFAGWTAVSIPVFAAMDGVRRIGQGAIQSTSGVGMLARTLDTVDADRLQASFRELAQQFNLPIDQVTDAVFRSSQVFQTQADAVDAARAALYSFQVGGVDVETSTRYLNAIGTGGGLTSSGSNLVKLFDQINEAQNRFGITINNTEAGMARASGSFVNAGGSLSYLLALLTQGQRVTGRTGENLGTAIQRAVGFTQRPSNQAALREFGIDPTKGIEQTFEQAFKAAKDLQGEQLQALATALSSPQYASYFVPILQNRDLFQQVQGATSPEASKGSAQRELDHQLSQVDQKIKELGVGLQTLGSNLAQSGMLNILGLGLETLNGMLRVVNGLLGAFNELPKPVRELITGLLTVRGIMAAGRRFNIGEALVGTRAERVAPYLLESDERRANRLGGKTLREAAGAARVEHERTQGSSFRATRDARTMQDVERAEYARIDRDVAAGLMDEADAMEAKALASNRTFEAEQKAKQAVDKSRGSLVQLAQSEELNASYQERRSQVRRRERDRVGADFLREEGVVFADTRERPFSMDAGTRRRVLDAYNRGEDPLGGDPLASIPVEQVSKRVEPRARAGRMAQAYRSAWSRALAAGQAVASGRTPAPAPDVNIHDFPRGHPTRLALERGLRPVAAEGANVAQASAQLKAAALLASTEARRAAGATRAIPGALRNGATAMRALGASMLAAVPELAVWVAIGIGIDKAIGALSAAADKRDELDRIARGVDAKGNPRNYRTRRDYDAETRRLQKQANEKPSFWTDLADPFVEAFRGDFSHLSPLEGFGVARGERVGEGQAGLRERTALSFAQARARQENLPIPGLASDELRRRLDGDFDAFNQGQITLGELRKRQGRRFAEIAAAFVAPGTKDRLVDQDRSRLLSAASSRAGFAKQLLQDGLNGLEGAALKEVTDGLGALLDAGLTNPAQQRNFLQAQLTIAARNVHKTDSAGRQAYAGAMTAISKTLEDAGKQELERALATATTQKQIDAAYARYYTAAGTASADALKPMLDEVRRQKADAQARLGRYQSQAASGALSQGRPGDLTLVPETPGSAGLGGGLLGPLPSPLPLPPMTGTGDAAKKAAGERARIKRYNQQIGDMRRAMARANKDADRSQQTQDELALIQAQGDLAATTAASPAAAAQETLRSAERVLRFMQSHRKAGKWSLTDIIRAQNAVAQARRAAIDAARQDAVDLRNAEAELAKSRTDDPVTQAQADLTAAQRNLAEGKFTKPADRIRAIASVNNAQRAVDNAIRDRARETIQAQAGLAKSRTDNPVTQATIDADAAAKLLRLGGFKSTAERMQAEDAVNTSRRQKERTVSDRKIQDLELEHDIGRLSDQAYIAGLQRIYDTTKAGSEFKRDLRAKILRLQHDLQNQSDFELNIGNIKLPSAYEVARIVKGGAQGVTVANNNQVTVHVNGPQDYAELGRVLERNVQGSGRAIARAAGMR